MYSGSVAATGTQSAGSAVAISVPQSKSRLACRSAAACGRCRMTHRSGWCRASSMARSSSSL
jgi:hypothetical protein